MIKTENLSRDFGAGRGLHGLTMHIPKGKIFGYIGPNGAGKTTTIKLLCSLYKPSEGRAFINGIEVSPENASQIKRIVGYMPDNFGVYEQMSVWEYLDFFCAAYHIPKRQRESRIRSVLELTRSQQMIDYQVASLSKGMTQRIGMAKTLLHDPEVLILDEPASGLDPYARIEMRKTILRLRDLGKTIMLSSHILPELAGVCDLIGILEKGKMLAFGSVEEVSQKVKENLKLTLILDSDSAVAKAVCESFTEVQQLHGTANELHFTFNGLRSKIPELVQQLCAAEVRIIEIKEEQADLEQVFLSVTHQSA
ncbi:MAG: ABC transporter ATP-binding protein [Lentisphaeria bacterium]|nr:ABC transporter ATP-binding protein [Lentisphaeria bacterium]MDY0175410.1 ABC transporter ATP-binding protein [Lentisphaeria bacterium]NLZ59130.1 ABC transporter ATP-binding protein [Lentisphaerota bacterium]